jgi:hypothetical protein
MVIILAPHVLQEHSLTIHLRMVHAKFVQPDGPQLEQPPPHVFSVMLETSLL